MRGVIALIGGVLVLGGCTWDLSSREQESIPAARYATVDEEAGSYGPVQIGEPRRAIFDAFGRSRRVGENSAIEPRGAPELYVAPTFLPQAEYYCYADTCFWVDDGKPRARGDVGMPGIGVVEGFEITSPGATTLRGVQIGDSLERAQARYPELRCDEIPPHEPLIPGTPGHPYCFGRVADNRFLWFGGDPIDCIAVGGFDFGED